MHAALIARLFPEAPVEAPVEAPEDQKAREERFHTWGVTR